MENAACSGPRPSIRRRSGYDRGGSAHSTERSGWWPSGDGAAASAGANWWNADGVRTPREDSMWHAVGRAAGCVAGGARWPEDRGSRSLRRRVICWRWLAAAYGAGCAAAYLFPIRPVSAQIGTTTEIIAGRVWGPDSLPLAGARVVVTSVSSGVAKSTVTRNDGRFSVLFRNGGAQYHVRVTAIGMLPAAVVLARQADEDRLVAEVRLGRTAVILSAVQVRAKAARSGAPPTSTAGGNEQTIPDPVLDRMPLLDRGDLGAVAALTQGVVPVAGTDSTPASFSVAGQPASQNNVTIDGSSFPFGSLPQDAVRTIRVVTNAYDVGRGQFSGGQIAATTAGGTQQFLGTATVTRQQPALQFPSVRAATFRQRYTGTIGSFGVGGPLVRDRAFYFVSFQHQQREGAVTSLLDADRGALTNLGAHPDSVIRFLQVIGRDQRVGRTGVPSTSTNSSSSALARFDWDVGSSHSVMVRADYRHLSSDATRIAPLALPSTGGDVRSDGGGVMAAVTSGLGRFVNEARAYASFERQSASAVLTAPLGVLRLASEFGEQGAGVAALQFGGSAALPSTTRTRLVEATNETSWLVGDSHRLKIGALMNATRTTLGTAPNGTGTFVYNSLGDLEAGQPSIFARTLTSGEQTVGSESLHLYVGDAWRRTPSLQIIYGARFETSRPMGVPAANPLVQREVNRRTDARPTDARVTPRLGFTYLIGNVAGRPSGLLKGGVGAFRGTLPLSPIAAVGRANGSSGAQSTLLCVGSAVPEVNWPAYLADPLSIPSTCVGGQSNFASTQPSLALFDHGFGAPVTWRASIGYQRRVGDVWTFALDGLVAYGEKAPYATDINLPAPRFGLSGEQGRPVYVRPSSIIPSNGSVPAPIDRPYQTLGSVLLVQSGLRSRTGQASASVTGPGLRSGGYTTVSYTLSRSIDQTNGFGAGGYLPTTAGDPNVRTWGTSDLERRHLLVGTAFTPMPHGIDLSVIARLMSGARYTPMVDADVNGDGVRNDRAFIPSLSPGAPLSSELKSLLATTDRRAASCLRSQLGGIAERNSCTTPWTPQLDIQLNWTPRQTKLNERLTVSLLATNTVSGIDRLLHGGRLRGWGQPLYPDRALLSVAGFEASTQKFTYRLNQHFGTPLGVASAFGVPFQLSLRARVRLGSDVSRAQIRAIAAGANGGMATVDEIRARVLKGVPNPVQVLLGQADSLNLGISADQRLQLDTIAVSFARQLDSVRLVMAQVIVDAGPRPDRAVLAPKILSINLRIIRLLQASVKDAQGVLTPEQWARVPERIRLPLAQTPAPRSRP